MHMFSGKVWKRSIIIMGLLVISVVLWSLLNHSNINSLMADDNLHQWEPIIEVVFGKIFSSGEIAQYDFFNHKGLDIFSSGYYGQLNPFMYFSYMVSRFLFSFDVKVLTVYMISKYSLGNIMLYLVLSELKISAPVKAVSLAAYGSMLFFFSWGIYYFTFNNYFFMKERS